MLPMFPWWIKYPNVNNEIQNLDWLLYTVKHLANEVKDFINLNTIKYADPILWDITSQYEANTIVVDPQTGDAFISTKPVPYGVSLSNTDYWTKIYNYANAINTLEEQIAAANEGLSTTASAPRSEGELVWLNKLLYKVTAPMIAGDSYVVDSNCVKTTIEEELNLWINTVETQMGSLSGLNTTDKSNLVAAINEVLNLITTTAGDLASLLTTDKSNLVAAINEVLNLITTTAGDLASLLTTDKSNLVAAINEVFTEATKPRLADIVDLKEDFGAVGDGVTDDTAAVQAFFDATLQGKVGFIPTGNYLCTSTINIDYSTGTHRTIKIFGAGAYRSLLHCEVELSEVGFYFNSGTAFDSFHTVFNDFGFVGNGGVIAQFGRNDFADCIGNCNFNNIFFANYNKYANNGVIACRYNYMFDNVFTNCVYVCNADGLGIACQIRFTRFSTFIGGSYSNANKGIEFNGGLSDTNTFIGADFENLNYGVYIDSRISYTKFITSYMDIWRPDLTPPTTGINAIYSSLSEADAFLVPNCVVFENPLFVRNGMYGAGGIDTSHINGVKITGVQSLPATPALPASGGTWRNKTGQDLIAYMWISNDDSTSKIISYGVKDDIFDGTDVDIQTGGGITSASIKIPTNGEFYIWYSGTVYWKLIPENI